MLRHVVCTSGHVLSAPTPVVILNSLDTDDISVAIHI